MKRSGFLLAVSLAVAAAAMAQSDMPKPAPEHKKLDIFAGSWTLEGEMKPGAMGPGGKLSENQKCEWMDGSFFVVCHADASSAMGKASGVSFMGYSTEDKTYTYREFNSWGEFMESKGSVDGDTWTWIGDDKMNGELIKGRFTMKFTSPTSYTFTYEVSQDGAKWTLAMDGKSVKSK